MVAAATATHTTVKASEQALSALKDAGVDVREVWSGTKISESVGGGIEAIDKLRQ